MDPGKCTWHGSIHAATLAFHKSLSGHSDPIQYTVRRRLVGTLYKNETTSAYTRHRNLQHIGFFHDLLAIFYQKEAAGRGNLLCVIIVDSGGFQRVLFSGDPQTHSLASERWDFYQQVVYDPILHLHSLTRRYVHFGSCT